MGEIIPFPIQANIHWNGRHLTDEEVRFVREFLLSVSRRIKIRRIRFSMMGLYGNDVKMIIDQLLEKKVILEKEKKRIYHKLNKE